MSRPGNKGSEGGRYPNKCCASRDLGSQEIPHPGRHPEKPQKPIGCLKWSSDVQDRLQERYLTVEGKDGLLDLLRHCHSFLQPIWVLR